VPNHHIIKPIYQISQLNDQYSFRRSKVWISAQQQAISTHIFHGLHWDGGLKQAKTASFHILSNSSFTITGPFIMTYAAERNLKQTNKQLTTNRSINWSINQSIKACYLCCGSSTNGIPNNLLEFCSGPSSSSTRKPNSSNLKIKHITIRKPT
jgi:hypothetical protein